MFDTRISITREAGKWKAQIVQQKGARPLSRRELRQATEMLAKEHRQSLRDYLNTEFKRQEAEQAKAREAAEANASAELPVGSAATVAA